MKNVIKYYYNLDVSSIKQVDKNYYLLIDNTNYLLCECDLNSFNKIRMYVNNPYFHKIINTINNNYYINFNNKTYILLKINFLSKKITIKDVIDFNFSISNIVNIKNEWINLWQEHVDYLEYQIKNSISDNKLLSNSSYYYIGLAENAIQFLKDNDVSSNKLCLSHKRTRIGDTLTDMYNPINIILDSKVRDLAEYIKDYYFYCDNHNIYNIIIEQINSFDTSEKILFYARLLYPTYFFDLFNQYLDGNEITNTLNNILSKANEYERFLSNILTEIKKTTYIINIDWLN